MAGTSVHIAGNITRDPELRYMPNGDAKLVVGVAVNKRWQKNGQWEESTGYFDVVAWRELAENVAESLTKGMRVVVTGTLEQRSYEGKDGAKRNVVEINADEIGPSLRWATCRVEKTERRGGNGARQESMTL